MHHPDYDILHFLEDDVFAFETTINPSKIVPHDWKKLRTLWKAVNADYKVALDRFTQSGTHEDNFYSFCGGKKEAYYLQLHLANKPGLNEMVEASLPEGCCLSSSTTATHSSTTETTTKKYCDTKKRLIDNLADALKENIESKKNNGINENKMNQTKCDLAQRKMIFFQKRRRTQTNLVGDSN